MSRQLPGDIVLNMDMPTDTQATCSRCGRRNDRDANFCQNCGAPIVRKHDASKARLLITERAVAELSAVRSGHIKNEGDVLRIDTDHDGWSLSVGPPQSGDCLVGNNDTVLLYASTEAVRLLGRRDMVIHCIDGRLIIYAEDEAGADASR